MVTGNDETPIVKVERRDLDSCEFERRKLSWATLRQPRSGDPGVGRGADSRWLFLRQTALLRIAPMSEMLPARAGAPESGRGNVLPLTTPYPTRLPFEQTAQGDDPFRAQLLLSHLRGDCYERLVALSQPQEVSPADVLLDEAALDEPASPVETPPARSVGYADVR